MPLDVVTDRSGKPLPPSPLESLAAPERRAQGTIIVLPGIEGRSRWNRNIVRGLAEANLPHAIEVYDWTLGRWLSLWTLRSSRRHREQSEIIANLVLRAHHEHPEAPIWLIGHSGGGAMAVLALERLPPDVRVAGAILLAPALSPTYDLTPALSRTRRGLWNFSSWGDLFFLVFGTTVMGTIDRRHTVSAGARGFAPQPVRDGEPRLREVPWRRRMLSCRNLAGHFGCVHSRFVREWIAPILQGGDVPAE